MRTLLASVGVPRSSAAGAGALLVGWLMLALSGCASSGGPGSYAEASPRTASGLQVEYSHGTDNPACCTPAAVAPSAAIDESSGLHLHWAPAREVWRMGTLRVGFGASAPAVVHVDRMTHGYAISTPLRLPGLKAADTGLLELGEPSVAVTVGGTEETAALLRWRMAF